MPERRVALVVPGRTSSGGSAFAEQLAPALEERLGAPIVRHAAPPVGTIDLSPLRGCSHVVFIGSRAERVPDAKVVFWPLNVAPLERHVVRAESSSLRNRLRHVALLRRLGRSVAAADGLVFGSFHARTLYQAHYPAGAALPYAVVPGGTGSGIERVERRVDPNHPLVLVVSHLYPYKGIREFVEAVAMALPRLPEEVGFRVAGADRDVRYAAAVHARAAELGLGERLTIAPADPQEMSALYARATLAVFASTCENAGSFALFDGLHAGAPTMCSDRSSMPEMVGDAVRLFNPHQPDLLADALVDLLADPAGLATLTDRAGAWSRQAPVWDGRADQLAIFLDALPEST